VLVRKSRDEEDHGRHIVSNCLGVFSSCFQIFLVYCPCAAKRSKHSGEKNTQIKKKRIERELKTTIQKSNKYKKYKKYKNK
jgi:hypothetical protein